MNQNALRRGVYKVINPNGMENDAIVEDINGGNRMPLAESIYRERGYKPEFDVLLTQNQLEENASISEFEDAQKAFNEAHAPVLKKQQEIASTTAHHGNPTDEELDLLDRARLRLEEAKRNMDRIAGEIRYGVRK